MKAKKPARIGGQKTAFGRVKGTDGYGWTLDSGTVFCYDHTKMASGWDNSKNSGWPILKLLSKLSQLYGGLLRDAY